MTFQDDFVESENTFNLIRSMMIDELERGEVTDIVVELRSRFHEAANELMNCGLDLTRDELMSAKLLAHETGFLGAEMSIISSSSEKFDRIKLLECMLDDLRSEELVLGELSGDLRAQIDEVRELEKQVAEAQNVQGELWRELQAMKKSKNHMQMILLECEQVEQLGTANEELRHKLEFERGFVESEIQSREQEREEKSRLHDHWIMEKRNRELQIESLNDELYIVRQMRKKHEVDQKELVELIARCENELNEVKSIAADIRKRPNTLDEKNGEIGQIDKAIADVLFLVESNREAKLRQAMSI